MLELTSAGRPIRLSPGTSVQLEHNSPLFDEEVVRGSFSYSFAVPAAPNGLVYGFPERPDADAPPGAELPAELALDGLPLLVGSQRIRSASASKYNVNLTGALGALATKLSGRAIHSFEYEGLRQMPPAQPFGGGAVGGLLQVPGWVLHANEVVRHPEAYDYVFAPVRVEDFYEPAPAPAPPVPGQIVVPPAVLNPWLANNASLNNGLPMGGTFTYIGFKGYQRLVFTLPNIFVSSWSLPVRSDDGQLLPIYGQLACPFPRLRYVLRRIFQESGLVVNDANFLPGELADLVIVSPADAMRSDVDAAGVLQDGFYLADALPDVTVAGLLKALRRAFGLIVVIDEDDRRVSTVLLRDILAAPASTVPDLTECLAGPAEIEINEPAALKLVYETDQADRVTQELFTQLPDPASLAPAVEQLSDLPATAPLSLASQTRLVRREGAYYKSRATWLGAGTLADLTWVYVGPHLSGVEVGGPGGEEYPQGFAFTQMGKAPFQADPQYSYQLDPAATEYMEVPTLCRPGFEPTNLDPKATPRPSALRLMFWRGLQPASDGSLYPLVTPLHTNQAGQAVGTLSLRLGGLAGTYEQLLRGWLELKRGGVVRKQPLHLSVLDLARFDLARKVRFDGIEYLVRKLAVTVPLRRPVMAELVRV